MNDDYWRRSNRDFFRKRKRYRYAKVSRDILYTSENLYGLKTDEVELKADKNGIFHIERGI